MSLESPSSGFGSDPGSSSDRPRGQRRRLLDDPLAIRALAHPVRLELLSIVSRAAEMTTADAARELGISHGLASHHLHQLAKYGFVEQVDGRDNRERPWRIVHTSYDTPDEPTPESAAAEQVLEQVVAEQSLARFLDWQERRAQWPEQWRRHTGIGQGNVYLTQEELAEITAAIDAAILPYVEERPIDDVSTRPPGSVPVNFTFYIVPLSDQPKEN
ncbi:MAG TPA: helix-turn-helix domain-containing protein [Actinomycetes bacterium]|nr:helix-turn-helix domain-containing protein [Actinomycetes bacterium]